MMNTNILETNQLTRNYGNLVAVNQLSLQVPRGSIYGFLGPNGAGKTTTIRMLLRLICPTSGNILFFGEPLEKSSIEQANRVGSLVESPSYYPHLTGRENLELVRRMRGEAAETVQRALKIVNLEKDANRLVKHYSLGMCQRLGLAMAFLGSPDVLVLDEPTNGLDPAGIHEIRELLKNLPDEHGVTVFVSSHLLSEVEQLATCIGIIQKGKLIFQGDPASLHASFQDKLSVGVDRPEDARSFLIHNGWQSDAASDHHILVPVRGQEDAAELNNRLHDAGFRVFDLHYQQLSLEDIFLKLTDASIVK
jgi:ABC-2 type transport system ATP-binding protein